MDAINSLVFVVALGFGLAQHLLDHDRKPLADGAGRWWTNGVLHVAGTALVTVFAAAVTWLTSAGATTAFTPTPIGTLTVPAQVGIMLLFHSFVQYWLHRAGHHVPLLWRWHRVHHTDKQLDATTAFRNHPFENALDYLGILFSTMVLSPSAAGLLGYFFVSVTFAMLSHSPTAWLPPRLDRALSWIIVTPRLHQLHHSTWQPETDTNYGSILVVWDRVFGTYSPVPVIPRAGFALGLDEFPQAKAQDPFLLIASPFLPADQRDDADRAKG